MDRATLLLACTLATADAGVLSHVSTALRSRDEAHQCPPPSTLQGPLSKLAFNFLHHTVHRGEVVQPRVAVFMIGLPGSGKSRVIEYRYLLDFRTRQRLASNSTIVLDLDAELLKHPDFDPKDPDKLYLAAGQQAYKWADARVEERFLHGLQSPLTRRLVVDGTGTNSERQIRRMRQARDAGFFVKALYVRVPARTAIARAAMRQRGVKPTRILAYQAKMKLAMQVAAEHADEVETVDVTFDDGGSTFGVHPAAFCDLFALSSRCECFDSLVCSATAWANARKRCEFNLSDGSVMHVLLRRSGRVQPQTVLNTGIRGYEQPTYLYSCRAAATRPLDL